MFFANDPNHTPEPKASVVAVFQMINTLEWIVGGSTTLIVQLGQLQLLAPAAVLETYSMMPTPKAYGE